MEKVVHVIRKEDIARHFGQILALEQDYLLATLYDAMQEGDEAEMQKCKDRLADIHKEMEMLKEAL